MAIRPKKQQEQLDIALDIGSYGHGPKSQTFGQHLRLLNIEIEANRLPVYACAARP